MNGTNLQLLQIKIPTIRSNSHIYKTSKTSICQIVMTYVPSGSAKESPLSTMEDDNWWWMILRIRGHFTFVRFRSIKLKLNNDRKICHWACLDMEDRPTVLSNGEYVPLLVLTDNRVQERHMSPYRSETPCGRLPPFPNVTRS